MTTTKGPPVNDELPPLPEPAYWMTRESEYRMKRYGGNSKGAVPVHNKSSQTATVPLYTADQLRAAVLAERERCADICDAVSEVCANSANGPKKVAGMSAAKSCASLIRGETV